MAKYRERGSTVEAEEFSYIDEIDGPQTVKRAKSLGLSRDGSSRLWEIKTLDGWRIVRSGDYLVYLDAGIIHYPGYEFKTRYEPCKD